LPNDRVAVGGGETGKTKIRPRIPLISSTIIRNAADLNPLSGSNCRYGRI
jgi:hypothetical protein